VRYPNIDTIFRFSDLFQAPYVENKWNSLHVYKKLDYSHMYYNIRATCDNEIMLQNSFSSYIFIFIRDKSMFINVGKK